MLVKWSRGNAPQYVAEHFRLEEFECKCGQCSGQVISLELLERLEALRTRVGGPLIINSGYRCEKHNSRVGGEVKSKHLKGLAADIFTNECTLEELAKLCETEFTRIGVAKTFIHVDVAAGKAKWYYK